MMNQRAPSNFLTRNATPVLLSCLLVIIGLAETAIGSPLVSRLAIGMMINVVLVTGLFIFIGNSGILSFGHLAFVGMSAYMTAWLTMRPMMKVMMLKGLPGFMQTVQLSPYMALIPAVLFTTVVALIIGAVLMRLSGIAAAIATLAFLAIFNTVYANSDGITGGVGSLAGIPTGLALWPVIGLAMLCVFIAWFHKNSSAGLMLQAVREDEVAASAVGITGYRVRLIAYVLSATVCAVAGYLQARYMGVISPDSFYINATFLALTMLIVGGIYSLTGAVTGVIVVTAVTESLVRLEGHLNIGSLTLTIPPGTANFGIAVLMCIVLVKRPLGFLGLNEWTFFRLPRSSRRSSTSTITTSEHE